MGEIKQKFNEEEKEDVQNDKISAEAEHLRAENKKLNYRITHLLRTIDVIESKSCSTN